MLHCSLWRPPNVHADCHAAQISQQAQGQDYFCSVSTCPVPQPAQSTLVSVRFSVSLVHTVHLRYFPCVSDGRSIYTLRTGAGSVKWGRWTALVAYSWFSTVDEALFQPSPQKIILLSVLANHRMWANKTIFTDLCTSKTTVRCRAVYLTGIRM